VGFSYSKRIELILPSQHGVILAIVALFDHHAMDKLIWIAYLCPPENSLRIADLLHCSVSQIVRW
jgi:hypothetical protein